MLKRMPGAPISPRLLRSAPGKRWSSREQVYNDNMERTEHSAGGATRRHYPIQGVHWPRLQNAASASSVPSGTGLTAVSNPLAAMRPRSRQLALA